MSLGTLLYVQADEIVRERTLGALEGAGYTIFIAESQRQALAFLQQRKPDFVLVEDPLPDGSAGELAQLTRVRCPDTTIAVLISADGNRSLIGADIVLVKPVLISEVLSSLKQLAKPAVDPD